MATSLKAAELFSFKGWTALVTGGGTGIGLMAATTLAANGAKVYITGRRQEVLAKSAEVYGAPEVLGDSGGQIIPLALDVDSKESIKEVVHVLSKHEKHLDLLVNNAGIWRERAKIEILEKEGVDAFSEELFSSDPETWSQSFQTNVTANFFVAAALLPLLHRAKDGPNGVPGNIINISSISGLVKFSQKGQFSYNASKAASISLSNMMAVTFSDPKIGVRVNSLAPGYFPSQMTSTKHDDETNKTELSSEGFLEERRVPAGRPGTDQEMGMAIMALAKNGYANGTTQVFDGGLMLWNA